MSTTINEVTPVQREHSTGLKNPCSYTTLGRTVYFDDGESLTNRWDRLITPASIPIVEQDTGLSTSYKWDVIRYDYKYGQANIHVTGVSASSAKVYSETVAPKFENRIEVVLDRSLAEGVILKYYVDMPVIPYKDENDRIKYKRFSKFSTINVTVGNNSNFATGGYPFSVQANVGAIANSGYEDDRAVEITIIISDAAINRAEDIVSDFNISINGFLE